jgi:hypothetical protein
MFAVVRAAIRAFAVGVAVGMLFAPRAGTETRKMLSERLSAGLTQLLELAALPPIPTDRARTNGHTERQPPKRTRAADTDARTT